MDARLLLPHLRSGLPKAMTNQSHARRSSASSFWRPVADGRRAPKEVEDLATLIFSAPSTSVIVTDSGSSTAKSVKLR
jgi:hypothetical protein